MRKRKVERTEISAPGKFYFPKHSGKWFEMELVNISPEGFCFSANSKHTDDLSQEPIIKISIETSKQEISELDFKVLWSGKIGRKVCLSGGEISNLNTKDYQKFLGFYNSFIQR